MFSLIICFRTSRLACVVNKFALFFTLGAMLLFLSAAPGMAITKQETKEGSVGVIEGMIMPGKLIKGHAKYEKKCESCHAYFSKTTQNRLCLDCHKKVAADLKTKTGFHGLNKRVKNTECKHCHTDHKGRDADIIRFDKELFDHVNTDFPLQKNHSKVKCDGCHDKKTKYRDTKSKCIDCHKKNDPHYGHLGENCLDCHKDTTWKTNSFDHNTTKFTLKGGHQKVICASCHPSQRWKKTPVACVSCHKINDAHSNSFGEKCENCHTAEGWKKTTYDHSKTKFPLKDKHQKVSCAKCHPQKTSKKENLPKTCSGCHKINEAHSNSFGEKCENCHTAEGWEKTTYDHSKTKFPLKDKHQKVSCAKCHPQKTSKKENPENTCYGCHKNDDDHKGIYGEKCENCHTTEGWKKATYDHSKTKFPLKDKHEKVRCDKCHNRPTNEIKPGVGCIDCHQFDDVHRRKQGDKCDRCHNQKSWSKDVFFDHDLTNFPLIGQHAVVTCEECHLNNVYKNTKKNCVSCHKSQDKHEQALGSKCASCHNPNSWKLWQFDHDSKNIFKLKGAHVGLSCQSCHKNPIKNDLKLPTDCFSCHYEDDEHRGGFGRLCERCHDSKSFKEINLIEWSSASR